MTCQWWKTSVFYQIYPRSFLDSNGDGVGDLDGIAATLDYLNDGTPDSLGIDAIWLNPIHPSPNYDWGYDVSDYFAVHPELGDLDSFDRLLSEAHRRNIRVILDLVPNHTSHQHPWFGESRSSRTALRRNWYIWAKGKDHRPPNNWESAFNGSAWTYDSVTAEWYMHSFLPEQPDLNYRTPEVTAAMQQVMRFWLDRGVDGFRLDAVARLSKDPDLKDNPEHDGQGETTYRSQLGIRVNLYCHDRPEVHDILRAFRKVSDDYPERVLVGEVWPREFSSLADYLRPDELHLAFDFRLLKCPFSARAFADVVNDSERLLGQMGWPTWTLSNHDFPRHISRYEAGPATEARARLAAMMLLTLRGTPFLYYGEEIGMRQLEVPAALRRDRMGRDGCRTPMQWSSAANGGFTRPGVTPWLPCGDYRTTNVADQLRDPRSMLSFYRRMIWFRKKSKALTTGAYRHFDARADDLFAYYRVCGNESLLIVLNFADVPRAIDLPQGRILLSTDSDRAVESSKRGFRLNANEGVIIAVE